MENPIEHLGLIAVIIMVTSYAFEHRGPNYILVFSIGCALAAFYAFLIGSTPFLLAEGIWALIAFKRYLDSTRSSGSSSL